MEWGTLKQAASRWRRERCSARRRLLTGGERLETRRVFADFGDAPAPYPTLLANNGASHEVVPGLFLGFQVDNEPDGVPSDFADTAFDDDGISFPQDFFAGAAVPIVALASAPGKLSAWFDWNADGDWNDPGEAAFVGTSIPQGESTLNVNVPGTVVRGTGFASRFRFSSQAVLAPTGPANDGEVEDYFILEVLSRPELRGRKFNDLDRDHQHDAGEPYVNGWLIEAVDALGQIVATATTADVDLDGNGTIDIETERGVWQIFDLVRQDVTIREAARPAHIRSAPDFTASMSGINVFPASGSSAVGFAALSYNAATNQIVFQLDYASMEGAVQAVSLREGTITQNGSLVANLLAAAGASIGAAGPLSGQITLDNTSLAKLFAGQLYVEVVTDTFPGFGEIRGQLLPGRDYNLSIGLGTQLFGLDFGGYTSETQNMVYQGTQGQVVLFLPDANSLTLPLVGSSTFKLYVASDGSAGDFDRDNRNEAALELSSLALRGHASLGQVDIELLAGSTSTGLAEERVNTVPTLLDLPPFATTGSVDQQLSFHVLVTITNRFAPPVTLRSATPITVSGVATSFPMAIGEVLSGTGVVDFVDLNGLPTGVRLTSASLTPSPQRPWQNPGQPLDIDNSGGVEPLDALLIVNELNNPRYSNRNLLPRPIGASTFNFPYLDADGSNGVEPLDALLIINRLNGATGEGEFAKGRSELPSIDGPTADRPSPAAIVASTSGSLRSLGSLADTAFASLAVASSPPATVVPAAVAPPSGTLTPVSGAVAAAATIAAPNPADAATIDSILETLAEPEILTEPETLAEPETLTEPDMLA